MSNTSFWMTDANRPSLWAASTLSGFWISLMGIYIASDTTKPFPDRELALIMAGIGALFAGSVLGLYFYTRR